MNVTQLFHKLRVISNVEIVVPLLPEVICISNQTPRYSLFQRLQRIRQRVQLRLAEQEMDVLGHDYVAINLKLEAPSHTVQGRLKDSAAFVGDKQTTAVVTAESDEMTLSSVVKTR